MSKRSITYNKPKDPSFLAKFKAEIGYKEGPTVDTKRQKLHRDSGESDSADDDAVERPDRDDEQPQVVVLEAGDLTKEQAEEERRRIEKEEAEAPADLNQRIVFKKKSKANTRNSSDSKGSSSGSKKNSRNPQSGKNKLSFREEDEEELEDIQ